MLGAAPGAKAQRAEGARILEAISLCRNEADAVRRVACFDRAAEALDAVRTKNGATLLTNEDMHERRQAQFGLDGREPDNNARPQAKLPEIDTLDSSVTRVGAYGRDQFTVTFADRSVWRTTEPARWPPRVGDAVHIRRGALGSYLGSFAKRRSIRIARVR